MLILKPSFLRSVANRALSPIHHCSASRFAFDSARRIFFVARVHGQSTRLYSTPLLSEKSFLTKQPTGFEYRIGASFSAKGCRFNPLQDSYSFDPSAPEEDVVTGKPASGQDAFFSSNVGQSGNIAFGVTDGVGGYADQGIDSAHFSHGLCRSLAKAARKPGKSVARLTARDLLERGYDGVLAEGQITGGGSTACIAVARSNGSMEVANLGDSGFIQLRLNAVHYYSSPQTHAFNTPYQLSMLPPRILAISRALGANPLHDYPKDASITTHQVRHGDVLVFATDGVWDNLSSVDLLKIVSRQMQTLQAWVVGENGVGLGDALSSLTKNSAIEDLGPLQTVLAMAITAEAKSASMSTTVDGPFARKVQRHFPNEGYRGGKVDDICVVVAVVVKEDLTTI